MTLTLGIDIGGTKTLMGLVDENGQIHHKVKLPTQQVLHIKESVIASLSETIEDYCKQIACSLNQIQGTAIGVPGILQRDTQMIVSCPNLLELDGMRLGPEMSAALDQKIWVENDVNLITLGEHQWGRGKDVADLACIFVGTGIGCGMIVNGSLYTGADGSAGEFGHISIEPEGRPCTCGGIGCLEMYCSGKALALAAQEILGSSGQVGQTNYNEAIRLNQAARSGNQAALAVMQKSFGYLGIGIANLVNIMNPRLIILGGGIVTGWPEALDTVREEVKKRCRVTARQWLELDYPMLGEQAGLLGAAVHVERALLEG